MNDVEIKKFKAVLLAKREEAIHKSRRPDDILIVRSNEQIETVQLAGEREFAVRSLAGC